MKIYQIYNEQRSLFGGEISVIEMTMRLLEINGNVTRLIMKSSRGIDKSLLKKISAFFSGIYNVNSYRQIQRLIEEDPPDVVHVHSLYPMFSPSVLVACRRAGIPVVMTLHNQSLTCPTWHHLYKGNVCEECTGGHEYRCVLKNCRENVFESIAYALRSSVARSFRIFYDNVTLFIVMTNFSKNKLINSGFRENQIVVVPNAACISNVGNKPSTGEYIAYAGRISKEKGISTLLSASMQNTELPIRIAGDGPQYSEIAAQAPSNVMFVGMLNRAELDDYYNHAQFVVLPSICYESFPVVAVEAMSHSLPIIASRLGGLPEVIEDGITGLLFEPGNSMDLANKMHLLWKNPELCRKMGKAGREKAVLQYSQSVYYKNLIEAYEKAINIIRE